MNTSVNFSADVLDRSQIVPVLVDFWAAWCGPCKMLKPVLERLAAAAGGRWELVKIDTEAQPDLAVEHGVRGIPDVRLYHRGREIARFSGALPETAVRSWLEEHLPTPLRAAMAQAREHLAAGRAADARKLLEPFLDRSEGGDELVLLAARAAIFEAPGEALILLETLAPSSPWRTEADPFVALAQLLESVDENRLPPPAAVASRLREARQALRRQDFTVALPQLLDALEDEPGYADRLLARGIMGVFRHLGLRHPLTDAHLRRYTMWVNS
jgi:putative thioredoxin